MLNTIWKFTLGPTYHQILDMPTSYIALHVAPVGSQSELGVNVWALVDSNVPTVQTDWYIVGTGHGLPPDGSRYVGTAVVADGLVWHVFDGGRHA